MVEQAFGQDDLSGLVGQRPGQVFLERRHLEFAAFEGVDRVVAASSAHIRYHICASPR